MGVLDPALPQPVASPAVFPGPAHTCCCYSAARLMSPRERGPPHLVPPVGPLCALSSSSILRTISTDFVISSSACRMLSSRWHLRCCGPTVWRGKLGLLTPCGWCGESPSARSEPRGGFPLPIPAGFRTTSLSHPSQCLSSVGACSGALSYMGERDS